MNVNSYFGYIAHFYGGRTIRVIYTSNNYKLYKVVVVVVRWITVIKFNSQTYIQLILINTPTLFTPHKDNRTFDWLKHM